MRSGIDSNRKRKNGQWKLRDGEDEKERTEKMVSKLCDS